MIWSPTVAEEPDAPVQDVYVVVLVKSPERFVFSWEGDKYHDAL